MKKLACFLLICSFASVASADIQDPPGNDYGPTRKLGRGLSNMFFGWTEVIYQVNLIQEREGNSGAASYGVVRGIGRQVARFGYGFFDVITFPFPSFNGTYKPPYPSNIPWIHGGYQEFPPELGWESRYDYARYGER